MARSNSKRKRTAAWTGADHARRKAHQEDSKKKKTKITSQMIQAATSHGTWEQMELQKMRLFKVQTQRRLEQLHARLSNWDDVTEAELHAKEQQQRRRRQAAENRKEAGKNRRKGPETWKLKGAARPAHLVYDFDVRYVDPHQKAHEQAQQQAMRSRNLLQLYKGRWNELLQQRDHPTRADVAQEYIYHKWQLGLWAVEAQQFKTAREAWKDCMELEGDDHAITTARCHLMRLYLNQKRPESARRLLQQQLKNSEEVWIVYSGVLLEYPTTSTWLVQRAIRSNVFCAYYLAFCDVFEQVVEYTEEIHEATNPLEQALEYGASEQLQLWKNTKGALDWLRTSILQALHGRSDILSRDDVDWKGPLVQLEQDYKQQQDTQEEEEKSSTSDKSSSSGDKPTEDEAEKSKQYTQEQQEEKSSTSDDKPTESEEEHDFLMFAGMFRTAMEMLEASGELSANQL